MRVNVFPPVFTHEGARSSNVPPLQALKRSVLACMLWEDNFYEDGVQIVDRIAKLCQQVKGEEIVKLAMEAHDKGYLRHVPLKLVIEALKKKTPCVEAIVRICSRPDQMTELLGLYWKEGKKPLAAQLKKGLAKAFTKFDEYQLAKYDRDNPIKLKDVLFLCHAKPKDEEQAQLWKRLISKTMKTPDTWEVRLSAGQDKKESFDVLLREGKMGKLAILRNVKNMFEAGIDKKLVKEQLFKKSRPMLPFQFIQAAKMCPNWEDIIDQAMIQCLEEKEQLLGSTVVFVDVSGSMAGGKVSDKSDTTCQDAAAALAILLSEVCEIVEIFSFSDRITSVQPRRGMALRDAINMSQPHSGTYLGGALKIFNEERQKRQLAMPDRIIVITDEQTHDVPPRMFVDHCYILNVSNCEHGIKNNGQWTTISGYSEACIDFIREAENMDGGS